MTTTETTISEQLCQFVRQYVDGYYCLELLRFFGCHPRTQFSELVILSALNSKRGILSIKKALNQLVDKKVVKVSIDNNIPLYSITEDESLRVLASKLVNLDWRQWQLMVRQALSATAA
jgi:hypothetical protein